MFLQVQFSFLAEAAQYAPNNSGLVKGNISFLYLLSLELNFLIFGQYQQAPLFMIFRALLNAYFCQKTGETSTFRVASVAKNLRAESDQML
tara:strand:- start:101 stop:373 length:273 start_codon:yes stop_codon:yes gene_type:complete